jgi:hypothetical protein
MQTNANKTQTNQSQAVANELSQKQGNGEGMQLVDNRPEAVAQRKLQEMANNSAQVKQLRAYQEMANNRPQVLQLVRKEGNIYYTEPGNTPFPTRAQAAAKEMEENRTPVTQPRIWDGQANTALPWGRQEPCNLTLKDVQQGILEPARNFQDQTIRTDGTIQLYIDRGQRNKFVAHVHVTEEIGGGLTQGSILGRGTTPKELVEEIKKLPGYDKAKADALALKTAFKGVEIKPEEAELFLREHATKASSVSAAAAYGGNQQQTNTGNQQQTNTGNQQQTNTGNQQQANTGNQQQANTGNQQQTNTGNQQQANTGNQQQE